MSGQKDAGSRGAVTGGKHADKFVALVANVCRDAGIANAEVHAVEKSQRLLPGYFRPSKEWDLVVTAGDNLVGVVEVKSQVGSFGNNFNNRVEEALGNATDFWAAYSKGLFKPTQRPWLGYLFMLEETTSSTRPTRPIRLRHYQADAAFQGLSYAQRYEQMCLRLVRERLYDAACFFISNANDGLLGRYIEPNVAELGIAAFCISLRARALAFAEGTGKANLRT
jgi:hypothetical protein